MESTYSFSGYGEETLYGYGNEDEAAMYLLWLNKDRQYNHYEMCPDQLTDEQEQADTLAFDLREALADLD